MRRLMIAAVCLVVGLSALVVGTEGFATGASTQSPVTVPSRSSAQDGVLIRKNAHAALPVHGGTVTSLNWAGYAVARGGKRMRACRLVASHPPTALAYSPAAPTVSISSLGGTG